jgi:hypothetical protein
VPDSTEPTNPLETAARSLVNRARDPKIKLLGLSDELLSLAAALRYADRRLVPAELEHPSSCECQRCCLLRLAAAQRPL